MTLRSVKYDEREVLFNPNLVFYADLAKHDGASFMSDDGAGHLCTVTGATWGLQGRTFDGTDDKIQLPTLSLFSSPTSLTFYSWIYPTASTGERCVITHRQSAVSDNWDWNFSIGGATGFNFRYWTSGAVFKDCSLAYSIPLNTWSFVSTTFDGTNARHYLNGVLVGTVSQAGAINTASLPLFVGTDGYSASWFAGKMCELFVYNRILLPSEIQNIYLATRWRYQ